MLRIRDEQMNALRVTAVRGFEAHLVAHVCEFAPELSHVVGRNAVRDVVCMGIERSERYGFTNRGPIRFYVEIMCSLGCDFDTDPQLPWAAQILNDSAIAGQMVRAEELYENMLDYLKKVIGRDNTHAVTALQAFAATDLETFRGHAVDRETRALATMRNVYPTKYAFVGETRLRKLWTAAGQSASSMFLSDGLAQAILAALMLVFGHGVLHDPLYPWVRATLTDHVVSGPRDPVDRLYRKTRVYFERLARNLTETPSDA